MQFDDLKSHVLVLASASPRRREILEKLGFRCEIKPAGIDEAAIRDADPALQTLRIAAAKARAIAVPGRITVAADTIVLLGSDVLEKPADAIEATAMLKRLSDKAHTVYTAVCVNFPGGHSADFLEATQVFFGALDAQMIEEYVKTPAPYDKAGGYGVQDPFGMTHITRIEGCYFNVMGFPASRFMRFLSEHQKFLR
jgi:septum formation protein